jgi:hypothetical protein
MQAGCVRVVPVIARSYSSGVVSRPIASPQARAFSPWVKSCNSCSRECEAALDHLANRGLGWSRVLRRTNRHQRTSCLHLAGCTTGRICKGHSVRSGQPHGAVAARQAAACDTAVLGGESATERVPELRLVGAERPENRGPVQWADPELTSNVAIGRQRWQPDACI